MRTLLVFFTLMFNTLIQAQIMQVEGDIDLKGAKISNVGDPSLPHEAANKGYADQIVINYFRSLPNGLQMLLDAGENPLNILAAGASKSELYGKHYQGGLIFYIDDLDTLTNVDGMVAAPDDLTFEEVFERPWGCNLVDLDIPNVTDFPPLGPGASIGEGLANQEVLDTASCLSAGDAARICAELKIVSYDDWFLPSIQELNEMYRNLHLSGHGSFVNDIYWSSTERDSEIAWKQNFSESAPRAYVKTQGFRVRAVRAF